jgi:hypothetical protein
MLRRARTVVLFAALVACHSESSAPPAPAANPANALVWGYPLVVTELTLRFYVPGDAVLSGQYAYPSVVVQ